MKEHKRNRVQINFTVESPFPTITIDGHNVADVVSAATVQMQAGHLPIVTLTLIPREIEIGGDARLFLEEAAESRHPLQPVRGEDVAK